VPNITPIRSEMKAVQLFFVFLHGALWRRYISSEKDEQRSRIITPSHRGLTVADVLTEQLKMQFYDDTGQIFNLEGLRNFFSALKELISQFWRVYV